MDSEKQCQPVKAEKKSLNDRIVRKSSQVAGLEELKSILGKTSRKARGGGSSLASQQQQKK